MIEALGQTFVIATTTISKESHINNSKLIIADKSLLNK